MDIVRDIILHLFLLPQLGKDEEALIASVMSAVDTEKKKNEKKYCIDLRKDCLCLSIVNVSASC